MNNQILEAAKLRKKIPENHVEVTTEYTGGKHGKALKCRYTADGIDLKMSDVVSHGWTSDPSPLNAIRICSISRDDLNVLKQSS